MAAFVTIISHRAATGCELTADGMASDQEGLPAAIQGTPAIPGDTMGLAADPEGTPATPQDTMGFPPYTLAYMPTTWLQQLARELHPAACTALLRTCRPMRDLLLSQRDLVVDITLARVGNEPEAQSTSQSRLVLACARSSRVKLVLTGGLADTAHGFRCRKGSVHDARRLFVAAVGAAGRGLEAITCVELKWLGLNALMPPWLISTCPNLTHLYLTDCHFHTLPHPIDAIPSAPQLKHLHIIMQAGSGPEQDPSRWQHQLRALPNITSLGVEGQLPLECIAGVASQLTRLSFPAVYEEDRTQHWVQGFCSLGELRMVDTLMLDEGVEALLSLPSLHVVHCKGFQLLHSYAHRPCNWTELGFKELHMASFDRLPLSEHVKLVADADECTIHPNADLAATQRVVAKVARCGGMAHCSDLRLYGSWDFNEDDTAILAAILPMLSTCKCDRLTLLANVTPELLAAIWQYLSRSMLSCIQFEGCAWSPGVWPLVLPSLPAGVDVMFSGSDDTDAVSEAELIVMCVHACRPVSVYVAECCDSDRGPEQLEKAVQAAMAAAGHQHVDLCIDGDYDPASDEEGEGGSSDEDEDDSGTEYDLQTGPEGDTDEEEEEVDDVNDDDDATDEEGSDHA